MGFFSFVFNSHLPLWHSVMGDVEARCCWLNELFCLYMARSTRVKWKDKGYPCHPFLPSYNEYWSPHISAAGTITGNHGNSQNELIDCCFIQFPSCVTSCIAMVQDKSCLWGPKAFWSWGHLWKIIKWILEDSIAVRAPLKMPNSSRKWLFTH